MIEQNLRLPPRRRTGWSTVGQLRDILRADILSGLHGAGDRLPSEGELMASLGASRTAIRAALDLLRDEGLIDRVPGAGTSVLTDKVRLGLDSLRGLAESFGPSGGRIANQVLSAELIPAPRLVASRLDIPVGAEVVLIERLRRLDGTPLSLDTTYLPADLAGELLEVDLRVDDIFLILSGPLGLRLGAAQISIEAVRSDAAVAALLELPAGSPLLLLERLTHLEDGRPVDLEFLRFRGDRLALTAWLTRNPTEIT